MYVVFTYTGGEIGEIVASGEDRRKVTAELRGKPEGEYVIAKLLAPITIRPPKRELQAIVETGPSFSPRPR